ncbi:CPBP family intramembrane metalloprotease [Christensenellaceae bacterium OttesenSCG-928-M15]|nr:CPBP family intramembrane metalloprotease [Christensenellaceae bacterium OttesenSCG-928-M15]
MKKETAANSKTQFYINLLVMIVCPASIAVSTLIAALDTSNDFIRQYAWVALFVELLLFFYTARLFIERQGGKTRFGLVKIMKVEWLFAICAGIALFYLATACNSLLHELYRALGVRVTGSSPMEGLFGWRLLAAVLLIAVIPGMAEETFFRGALLYAWLPGGRRRAILHSALVFSLLHLQPQILPIFVPMGILFSYIAVKTGSCYTSMGMHIGYNFMVVLYNYAVQGAQTAQSAAQSATIMDMLPGLIQFMVFGLTLGYLSLRFLFRASRRRQEAMMKVTSALYKNVQNAVMRDYEGMDAAQGEHADGEEVVADISPKAAHGRIRSYEKMSKIAVTITYILLVGLNVLAAVQLFSVAGG